jgi:hypothetical protein
VVGSYIIGVNGGGLWVKNCDGGLGFIEIELGGGEDENY